MADEEEKAYKIINLANNTESKSSRDFTGKGRAEYSNGDVYEGEYKDGLRCGQGKYFYLKGNKYEGMWQNNVKSGVGKFEYNKKGVYFGYFQNGRRHGEGIFTYVNGDTYSGKWKYGKKHDFGTYLYADTGMKLEGMWEGGKFVKGKWILPNGVFYEGDFVNNKPNQAGVWYFNSGNEAKGNYNQKKNEDEEDEAPPAGDDEEEEDAPTEPKVKVKLEWKSRLHLIESAKLIKEIPALE